jgi:hypothetical protein
MNVQYAGSQFMSKRLIEVIQELRDYLGPKDAHGLSDEEVVHRVMCKAIDYYRQLSELKPKERLSRSRRTGTVNCDRETPNSSQGSGVVPSGNRLPHSGSTPC